MRAPIAAEVFELVAGLFAKQILDGVEIRRGVRLDCDAVLRTQGTEIQRRHDGGERGRRGLVPADLHAIVVLAQVVGVVDGPARQPQHFALQLAEYAKIVCGQRHVSLGGVFQSPGRRAVVLIGYFPVAVFCMAIAYKAALGATNEKAKRCRRGSPSAPVDVLPSRF